MGERGAKRVKLEPDFGAYDGSYDCLICAESVRAALKAGRNSEGLPVLKCSECSANPYHRECAGAWVAKCPQCSQETVQGWEGPKASAVSGEVIEIDDLDLSHDKSQQPLSEAGPAKGPDVIEILDEGSDDEVFAGAALVVSDDDVEVVNLAESQPTDEDEDETDGEAAVAAAAVTAAARASGVGDSAASTLVSLIKFAITAADMQAPIDTVALFSRMAEPHSIKEMINVIEELNRCTSMRQWPYLLEALGSMVETMDTHSTRDRVVTTYVKRLLNERMSIANQKTLLKMALNAAMVWPDQM